MENSKLSEIATPSEIASVLQSDEGRQALEYFLNNFADHGIFNDGNYSCKKIATQIKRCIKIRKKRDQPDPLGPWIPHLTQTE